MSLNLIRLLKTNRLVKMAANRNTQAISVRFCGWIDDWKPGPYPRTPEEREAAAKKYNMIPEDYEPYEEGSGFGDYPKLVPVGQDARDPYETFDYYYRRRNYGETLHIEFDLHTSERSNPNFNYRYSNLYMVSVLIGILAIMSSFKFIDWYFDLRTQNPYKPKQFYNSGKKNYTFEPLD